MTAFDLSEADAAIAGVQHDAENELVASEITKLVTLVGRDACRVRDSRHASRRCSALSVARTRVADRRSGRHRLTGMGL